MYEFITALTKGHLLFKNTKTGFFEVFYNGRRVLEILETDEKEAINNFIKTFN